MRCGEVVERIIAAVCERHGLTEDRLMSSDRHRDLCDTRWLAFYLCRWCAHATLQEIGRRFGKDNSTVLYGARQMENLCDTQPETRAAVLVWVNHFAADTGDKLPHEVAREARHGSVVALRKGAA